MKPFLVRLGAAVLLALVGLGTGYALVASDRNDLRERLAELEETCDEELGQRVEEKQHLRSQVNLQKATLLLYRSKRDLDETNFGLALRRLDQAGELLGEAQEGLSDTSQQTVEETIGRLEEVKDAIASQDPEAADQVDGIIQGLESV